METWIQALGSMFGLKFGARAEDQEVRAQAMEWLIGGFNRYLGEIDYDARERQLLVWNTPRGQRRPRTFVRYE